ncbi:lactate racemase domain-containing protein [Planctomicrobium sp. SH527]|uniref:lactate racemase domain-containing protein n=1 Tax=Planctomicrobium sp. SH527 TaxID=3448123 RepID=UPI003F5C2D50
MPSATPPSQLTYGRTGHLSLSDVQDSIVQVHTAPAPLLTPEEAIRNAFDEPIDYPEISNTILPDDIIAVVIEVDTPMADQIFAELWRRLENAGVSPENVTIVQPAVWKTVTGIDPRAKLPQEIQNALKLHRHDPTDEKGCAYVASTAGGERIYLSQILAFTDVVFSIGPVGFDPILGVKGGASCLYPGLSDVESIRRSQGQGHEELRPQDPRPFREFVDEVGWLLGLQFSVVVVPSGSELGSSVLVGQSDAVIKEARKLMESNWIIHSTERAEQVLVTVPVDANGHGWDQVAAAVDAGRRLVERNGRIIVLSQIDSLPGPGLEILKSVREPHEALRPIQKANTPDLIAASRIAAAADWANVSLLSKLDPTVVSDLFMIPLESETEVLRLIENGADTVVIEGGQHTFVQSVI